VKRGAKRPRFWEGKICHGLRIYFAGFPFWELDPYPA
jgi:hypothetical protein